MTWLVGGEVRAGEGWWVSLLGATLSSARAWFSQVTFLSAVSSFLFLNDDRIQLDSSKTSSTGFYSMSSWGKKSLLEKWDFLYDPETNVSDADLQRMLQVGERNHRKFPLPGPCQQVFVSSSSSPFLVRYSSWKVPSRSGTLQKLGRRYITLVILIIYIRFPPL